MGYGGISKPHHIRSYSTETDSVDPRRGYTEFERLGWQVGALNSALTMNREEYESSLRQWQLRGTEWDSERLQLKQQLGWFKTLLDAEKGGAVKSEETAAGLRRQLAEVRQEGATFPEELEQLRRNQHMLEARNRQLEAARSRSSNLTSSGRRRRRARAAEQQLLAELKHLKPSHERVHDLEELVPIQRAEIEAPNSERCRAELAVRRAASLEESLEEARDTILELKGLLKPLR